MSWNGGITKKRLNFNSRKSLQDQFYVVSEMTKIVMNALQKGILTCFTRQHRIITLKG